MDYDYSDALKYAEEQGIKHVVYMQNNEGKTRFGGAEAEEKYYILLKNIYNNSEKRFRTMADFKKYLEL
jgi:hypothetical protein